jgi:hypothetical protein
MSGKSEFILEDMKLNITSTHFSIRPKAENAIEEMKQESPDKFFEISRTNINLNLTNVLEKKSSSLESLQMV